MQCWNFSFLGGVEATYENVHLNGLMGKKAGAVLALLALSPGRARPREEIIDLIWPEVDFEEARDRFKQQLTLLRKQLEPEGVAPGSVLITNRSQAGIATGHQSDVALFQDRLRRAALAAEPQARAQCLREALALYKGEFAPGFYQDVLLTERERLATLARQAQKRLAALEAGEQASPPADPPLSVTPRAATAAAAVHTENRFFGRQEERTRIPQLLAQHRLVTLLGPGGTGKTRLMQELQTDLPNAPLVYLSGLRNGAVLSDALVAFLNLPSSDETALARLQSAFKDKPTLLLLDNLEQLLASGGAEAVAQLLETLPTLRLLVSSRIKLHLPQECVYPIAPLPPDEAVALFVNRAALARSSFALTEANAADIAHLCQRLDGLPLAVELAAARAAILTPAQILERLNRRFDLLTDRRRDREERHTSLRATLDWGWGLLAPDVQRFFARLCVFRGSFSLEAAEEVTGEWLAIDYLHGLADASFLLVENVENGDGHPRFRLLETLRDYGREKWDVETRDTLPPRHSAFFAARAEQWAALLKGPEFAAALLLFRQDHDNLRAALDHALHADPVQAVRLCEPLALFWQFAYLKREALDYLQATLDAVQAGGMGDQVTPQQWAALHDNLASTHRSLQQYAPAYRHLTQALAHHDKQLRAAVGEAHRAAQVRRAGTLHNLGNNFYAENRLDEAHPCYAEAAQLNRSLGSKPWLANNLNGLCCVCGGQAFQTDDLAERTRLLTQGLTYAHEAVALCRALPKAFYLCSMLVVQSGMLLGLARDTEALPVLAEAFALAANLENWEVLAEVLLHYHHLAFRGARWDAAAQLLGAAEGMGERWEIDLHTGQMPHLVITDERRARLASALGAGHYDALYQGGFSLPPEALHALVAAVPAPPRAA